MLYFLVPRGSWKLLEVCHTPIASIVGISRSLRVRWLFKQTVRECYWICVTWRREEIDVFCFWAQALIASCVTDDTKARLCILINAKRNRFLTVMLTFFFFGYWRRVDRCHFQHVGIISHTVAECKEVHRLKYKNLVFREIGTFPADFWISVTHIIKQYYSILEGNILVPILILFSAKMSNSQKSLTLVYFIGDKCLRQLHKKHWYRSS